MRHLKLVLSAVALLTAAAGAAAAQDRRPGVANVTVSIGQSMQQKVGDYGQRDVDELTRELAKAVGTAVDRAHGGEAPNQLQLVLEDATPNRPTPHQLGENASLSANSIGLGGAWVDGAVAFADGRKVPVSFSFYESDLRNELAPSTWGDADRAFDMLARRLAKGDIPNQAAPATSSHGSFARWPR